MELLFWLDAFRRASAASVTAIVPTSRPRKGDKKDAPRVSIRARVCADAIEAVGTDRVITLDLHAPQIQGFFKAPWTTCTPCRTSVAAIERLCARRRWWWRPTPGSPRRPGSTPSA